MSGISRASTCCQCPLSNKKFPYKPFLEYKCAVNCTGLLPLLMHFSSQLVRPAKARLKTLDVESNSMLLSADVVPSDVMPSCSSGQEVLKIVVDVIQKPRLFVEITARTKFFLMKIFFHLLFYSVTYK